jgi:hypothetical protein
MQHFDKETFPHDGGCVANLTATVDDVTAEIGRLHNGDRERKPTRSIRYAFDCDMSYSQGWKER